jgi:hypothetical protein
MGTVDALGPSDVRTAIDVISQYSSEGGLKVTLAVPLLSNIAVCDALRL